MKRFMQLILVFLLIFALTFQSSLSVFAKSNIPEEKMPMPKMSSAALTESEDPALPKSATVGNDVFLHGRYIEVGISSSGSFGTYRSAPAGFHPTEGNLGFIADDDGFDFGDPPIAGDYFLPGIPEEGFTLGYRKGSGTGEIFNFTNVEREGIVGIPSKTTDLSSGDTLAARTVGLVTYYNVYPDGTGVGDDDYAYATDDVSEAGKLQVEQLVSFGVNDKYFKNVITLTNMTEDETLYDIRYMRSFDPDQDSRFYGEPETYNAVTHNPPQDDLALVRAFGVETRAPIFLLSFEDFARAASLDFTNRYAYAPEVYDADGSKLICDKGSWDEAITMTFAPGNLAPGESVSFTYYTSLNGDIDEGMEEIEHEILLSDNRVYDGSQEGTVIGTLSTRASEEFGSHHYQLVDDAGGRFKIEGDLLMVADGSLIDFSEADSHQITVRVGCTRTERNYNKTFIIQVLEDSLIGVEADSIDYDLMVGESYPITLTAHYASGRKVIIREGAEFSSSDPEVAEVNANGLITGVSPGEATIYASYEGVSAEPIYVNVTSEGVRIWLKVDSTKYTLIVGESHQTVVNMVYSIDDTLYNVTGYTDYSSSNPEVASVNATGLVNAINAGTAVIQAVYNELYAPPINVTVVPKKDPEDTKPKKPSKTRIGEERGQDGSLLQYIYEEDLKVSGDIYTIKSKVKNDVHKFVLYGSFISKQYTKKPKTVLRYLTETGDYKLPLASVSIEDISEELGLALKDSNLIVSINKINDERAEEAEKAAEAIEAEMVSPLIEYRIEIGNNKDKMKELENLGLYLSRTIDLSSEINSYSTVGVMYDPELREFIHTPTLFTGSEGKAEAEVKRYGNSLYAILRHSKSFDDLNGHWSKEEVERLASKLVVNGKTSESYEPDENTTRAEFIAMIVRALGIPEEPGEGEFSDITDQWYAGTVNSAFKLGLIKGYNDGTFRPNNSITREEMAMVICRALDFAGAKAEVSDTDGVLGRFGDQDSIAAMFKEAVAAGVEAEIIKGDEKGNFKPNNEATRAEAAAMTIRMMNYLKFIN